MQVDSLADATFYYEFKSWVVCRSGQPSEWTRFHRPRHEGHPVGTGRRPRIPHRCSWQVLPPFASSHPLGRRRPAAPAADAVATCGEAWGPGEEDKPLTSMDDGTHTEQPVAVAVVRARAQCSYGQRPRPGRGGRLSQMRQRKGIRHKGPSVGCGGGAESRDCMCKGASKACTTGTRPSSGPLACQEGAVVGTWSHSGLRACRRVRPACGPWGRCQLGHMGWDLLFTVKTKADGG